MSPKHVIAELQRVLPDNAIVTCDAGENRIFMTRQRKVLRCKNGKRGADELTCTKTSHK